MDPYIYSKDILWLHYDGIVMVTLHRQLLLVPVTCYLIILLFYVTRKYGNVSYVITEGEPLLKYVVGQSS